MKYGIEFRDDYGNTYHSQTIKNLSYEEALALLYSYYIGERDVEPHLTGIAMVEDENCGQDEYLIVKTKNGNKWRFDGCGSKVEIAKKLKRHMKFLKQKIEVCCTFGHDDQTELEFLEHLLEDN